MGKLVIKGQAVSKGVTNGNAKDAKEALDRAAKALKAAKAGRSGTATTTVDGKTYRGRTVSVQGNGVYVDGKKAN